MSYTTVSAIKTYLGISTGTDDGLLSNLLVSAQTIIDAYTRRTFAGTAQTTRYFDAYADVDKRTLWLDEDLCIIGTVTNGDGASIGTADYTTEPRNNTPYNRIVLKGNSTAAWTYNETPENAIAVTGAWHYSTVAPADIEHAATRLVAWMYAQKDNHADQDRAFIVGNTTVLPTAMPTDVVVLLEPYKKKGPP